MADTVGCRSSIDHLSTAFVVEGDHIHRRLLHQNQHLRPLNLEVRMDLAAIVVHTLVLVYSSVVARENRICQVLLVHYWVLEIRICLVLPSPEQASQIFLVRPFRDLAAVLGSLLVLVLANHYNLHDSVVRTDHQAGSCIHYCRLLVQVSHHMGYVQIPLQGLVAH